MSARPRPPRRRRWRTLVLPAIALIGVGAGVLFAANRPAPPPQSSPLPVAANAAPAPLRPVADFDGVADPQARSLALFDEAMRVIASPRCMNCHPVDNHPTQTDIMRAHEPMVVRGPDGGGAATMRCATCHHGENDLSSGVPGDPHWALAPIEMGWQGRSPGEICRQIQDPARGGMSRAELLHHMAEDELVGWAWRPGGARAPAPGTQEQFGALIAAWLETGGACPS
jgi:hypothetical protein